MTDYRLQTKMNIWGATTDDNTSMMEAFMTTSDPVSLWSPQMTVNHHHHHLPTSTTASSSAAIASMVEATTKPVAAAASNTSTTTAASFFNQEGLQRRLQTLIEGARESWTYAIFWQPPDGEYTTGSATLCWGDGYYKGEEDKGKRKNSTSARSLAEQEHRKKVLRELNSLISGQCSADDAVDEEVTDTEWFFLISMTQAFVTGQGLPGQALYSSNPVWVTGADSLASSHCERARQARVFGLQTLVYIPLINGVVELGSTEFFYNCRWSTTIEAHLPGPNNSVESYWHVSLSKKLILNSVCESESSNSIQNYDAVQSNPSNTAVQEVLLSGDAKLFQGKDYDSDSGSSCSVKNYSTLKRKPSALGEDPDQDSDHATLKRKLSGSGEPDDEDSDFTDINAFIRIMRDGARRQQILPYCL